MVGKSTAEAWNSWWSFDCFYPAPPHLHTGDLRILVPITRPFLIGTNPWSVSEGVSSRLGLCFRGGWETLVGHMFAISVPV